jgi:Fe-S-cluster containining protein
MRSKRQPSGVDDALRAVRDVYSELERRPLERDCIARTDCCRFRLTGRTPYVTKGEALLVAKAVRSRGRRAVAEPVDGSCPLLDTQGRCTVYEARPFGCRTHFCAAAGGPLPRQSLEDLIRRLAEIDVALGGDGVRALPVALDDALAGLSGKPGRGVGGDSSRR